MPTARHVKVSEAGSFLAPANRFRPIILKEIIRDLSASISIPSFPRPSGAEKWMTRNGETAAENAARESERSCSPALSRD
jgi:hypothetical protein